MLVERNVAVPMRDGTVLSADVLRPDADGDHPVMLFRLPYDKSFVTSPAFPFEGEYFVPRGYICVAQDVRGTFASDGTFDPLRDEGADTADTVQWAATIEGANGKVVLAGQSYLASIQVQGAAEAPRGLVGICPASPLLDITGNGFRRGGAVESAFFFAWATRMASNTASRNGRDDQVAALAALVEDQPENPFPPLVRSAALHVPFDDVLTNYDDPAPWVRRELTAAADPDGGQYLAPQQLVPKITVPALYVTSWYDMFLHGVLDAYALGVASGAAPVHLVVGPWAHAHYGIPQTTAGDLDFGPDAQLLLWPLMEQFFAPLVGLGAAEPLPGVRYFTMGINEWRTADVWPPESTEVRFFAHSAGGAVAAGTTGTLDTVEPADEPADEWTHDPVDPVPSTGGQTWSIPNGPMDQAPLLARADVLGYDSAPLTAAVEVTGAVRAEVWLDTDAASADVVAALLDVHPDGKRFLVTQGILRQGSAEQPLHADGPVNFRVDLWATSHVFLAGHRIALHVAGSDFPHWDVNPSDGSPWATCAEPQPARHRVLHEAARPSVIVLPVVGAVPSA